MVVGWKLGGEPLARVRRGTDQKADATAKASRGVPSSSSRGKKYSCMETKRTSGREPKAATVRSVWHWNNRRSSIRECQGWSAQKVEAVPIDVVNSKKMWSPVTALTVTVLTVTVQVASDSGHKQLESRVPVFFSIADDNGHGRRESRVTEIEVVGNGSRWRLWLRTTRVAGDRRCITGDGDRGQNSHVGEMFKQYRFFS
ncbi:hypothetical protein AXG93_3457s1000 [Marchantia polymorpha subsp. ruderalis]|uniref:Uncharacterized protein n=1 Tax=Marchantia polymorpha subsp. ruderalis TaxID=1480154 RepID=A0A176VZH0_MARPO|nr:hypothetical protein AXG93_3457s1000 [Marchantia polymorpha subsp. ruderalis]